MLAEVLSAKVGRAPSPLPAPPVSGVAGVAAPRPPTSPELVAVARLAAEQFGKIEIVSPTTGKTVWLPEGSGLDAMLAQGWVRVETEEAEQP